jgi:hypothetical protein
VFPLTEGYHHPADDVIALALGGWGCFLFIGQDRRLLCCRKSQSDWWTSFFARHQSFDSSFIHKGFSSNLE